MDIIIGREGNQPFPLTEKSISRKHAVFSFDRPSGVMTIRDNGSSNGTYIKVADGSFQRIQGRVKVALSTIIRLGAIETFQIKDLLANTQRPEAVDISKLRSVYEIYNANRMSLETQTSNIMMIRLVSMTLSGIIGTSIASAIIPENSMNPTTSKIIQALTGVIALIVAWIVVNLKNKSLIRRKDQNERYFKKNYCCPKCGYHLGNHIYSNILAEGQCPNKNCKCKFTGK